MEKLKTSLKKLSIFCSMLCCFMSASQAAIPSDFQNEKDLGEIVSYIKSNHEVLSSLSVIDLAELAVYYGDNCRVQFARKTVEREAGWVGPAEPIEFKAKECLDGKSNSSQKLPKEKVQYGVIVSAEAGDTACYLQIKDDSGEVHDELAGFDLCEDQTLLNKPSEFIYERTSVMAASCEGDPDCKDTESVWLITEIK